MPTNNYYFFKKNAPIILILEALKKSKHKIIKKYLANDVISNYKLIKSLQRI